MTAVGPDQLRLSAGEERRFRQVVAARSAWPEAHGLIDPKISKQLQIRRSTAKALGIDNPFLRVQDGIAGTEAVIDGSPRINFASYNYLGLNGHPKVVAAATEAIDRYGTSCSASRLLSGEKPIHRLLERRLAELHQTEDCIAFVSGHATNVSVIGHLLDNNDLILHDAMVHNSILQGAKLSGAQRLSFPHNDVAAAEQVLERGDRYRRVLLVLEGQYSVDGDIPDLPAFSALARRHNAFLMVDEAHSIGVLGQRGHGIAEHFGLQSNCVDLWMGTLSKAFAACGGYIACRRDLAEYLRFSTPSFVYSVGMPPPITAAAIAAIDVLHEEPARVAKLKSNARMFLEKAKAAGLNTGRAEGFSVVPIITGSEIAAARLSNALFGRGINVQPIFYPAVSKNQARLRFFLTSEHRSEQIDAAIAALVEEAPRISKQKVDFSALMSKLCSAE